MIEQDLPFAIMRGQLYLCYQPKVQLAKGRAMGVEALLRWRHPTLGDIPPLDFIPLAEESGFIF
ncbi:Phytochrome-like protein cph2 [Geobacillus sp. BCO2]|nr:Phytochrome-like protein cph2 [Geobacillus sp. BCO2]